jgi:hypothetical protein
MSKGMKVFLVIGLSCFALQFNVNAQKGKNKAADCVTYSENISQTLPVFPKTGTKAVEQKKEPIAPIVLADDLTQVDSVGDLLKKYYSNKTKTRGWRIQIWDGQNHVDMNHEITRYKENFSDYKVAIHDEYDKTVFRVRLGDYSDRLEAFRYLQVIKKEFPNALLVPDQIDISKL